MTRREVHVPADRLARWLAGFAERHGTPLATAGPDVVELTGADGDRAWIHVPFPPLASDHEHPGSVLRGPGAQISVSDPGTPTADNDPGTPTADNDPGTPTADNDPGAAENDPGTPTADNDPGDPRSAGDARPPAGVGVLDRLVEHACRDRRVGVLLVRRGGHAAGVFDGPRLIAHKVGTSYVQGGTKAGGWSQQRFARRRANQADAAFAAAADTAARILGDAALDAFVAGGDRDAVRGVLNDRRLAHLTPTGPWLQAKDPRLAVLTATPDQFRAVRIELDP